MTTTIVLFNRDLRVHDHPALRAAAARGSVIPLFVFDPWINAGANRTAFLIDALSELDAALTKLGAPLVVRRGPPVDVVASLGADAVYASSDYTPVATRREDALQPTTFPGVACVEPGAVTPSTGADFFTVFTPYFRRWRELAAGRPVAKTPRSVTGVKGLKSDPLPKVRPTASNLQRPRSADVHFGRVSPRQLLENADDDLARNLCWRDFFLQYFAANPSLLVMNRREDLNDSSQEAMEGWKRGETGCGIVDAGMRQLVLEGWMPNRMRMVTASYLINELGVDWRYGAAHFMEHLVDGDVANNTGNWMWVAHHRLNQRPRPPMNPDRQAKLFDPTGEYRARYAPS